MTNRSINENVKKSFCSGFEPGLQDRRRRLNHGAMETHASQNFVRFKKELRLAKKVSRQFSRPRCHKFDL